MDIYFSRTEDVYTAEIFFSEDNDADSIILEADSDEGSYEEWQMFVYEELLETLLLAQGQDLNIYDEEDDADIDLQGTFLFLSDYSNDSDFR